jgi:hypothetical protein
LQHSNPVVESIAQQYQASVTGIARSGEAPQSTEHRRRIIHASVPAHYCTLLHTLVHFSQKDNTKEKPADRLVGVWSPAVAHHTRADKKEARLLSVALCNLASAAIR